MDDDVETRIVHAPEVRSGFLYRLCTLKCVSDKEYRVMLNDAVHLSCCRFAYQHTAVIDRSVRASV